MNLEKVLRKVTSERTRGNNQKALEHLQKAIKSDPKEHRLYYEAALSCFDLGNTLDALNYIKTIVSRFPQHRNEARKLCRDEFDRTPDPILGTFLLESYVQRREFEDAALLGANFPADLRSALLKRLSIKKGNVARALSSDPSAKQTLTTLLYSTAFIFLGEKNAAGYANSVGEILNHNPEEVTNVGKLLKEVERRFKNVGAIRFQLGRAYLSTERPEKGLPKFLEAMARDETLAAKVVGELEKYAARNGEQHVLVNLVKGEGLLRGGEVNEGVTLIGEFLEEAEDDAVKVAERLDLLREDLLEEPRTRFLQAKAYLVAKKPREAVKILEKLVKKDESLMEASLDWLERHRDHASFNAELLQLLASRQMDLGRVDDALKSFDLLAAKDLTKVEWMIGVLENAREHGAENPGIYQRLANLYAAMDRPGDAQAMLKQFEEAAGNDVEEVGEISRTIIESCGVTFQACITLLRSSLESGELEPAIDHLVRLTEERPEDIPKLADHLLDISRETPRALEVIKKLLEKIPEPFPLPFKLLNAVVLIQTGNEEMGVFELDQILVANASYRERVLEEYRTQLEKNDANPTLNLAYFSLLLELYRYDEACEAAASILARDPQHAEHLMTRLEREIEMEEANLPLWENLVASLIDIKLFQPAEALCDRLAEKLPENRLSLIHFCRGDLALHEGYFDDALESYARAFAGGGVRPDRMAASLERFLQIHPDNPRAHLYLARARAALGEFEPAIEHFERAATGDTQDEALEGLKGLDNSWRASFSLGKIYARQGDLRSARRYFAACQDAPAETQKEIERELRRSWSETPDDTDAGVTLARSLIGQGKIDEGLDILEKVLETSSESAPTIIHTLLALQEGTPRHLGALRLLARVHLSQGHQEKARDLVLQIGEMWDEDPAFCSRVLKEFEGSFEDDPEISLLRARALSASGNPGDSLELFESLLEGLTRSRSGRSTNVGIVNTILPALRSLDWPEELRGKAKLLAIDCMIESGDAEGAERELESFERDHEGRDRDLLRRCERLIESERAGLPTILRTSRLRRALGDTEGSIRMLRDASTAGWNTEERTRLRLALATGLRENGAFDEAETLLGEILGESGRPDDILKEVEEITVLEKEQRLRSMRERWERNELDEDEILDLASRTFEAGDPSATRGILNEVTFADGRREARRLLLAKTYAEEERYALALNILTAVSTCEEEEIGLEIAYLKAVCFEHLGRWGDAYRALADVLDDHPDYRDIDRRIRTYYARYIEECRGTGVAVLEKNASLEGVTR